MGIRDPIEKKSRLQIEEEITQLFLKTVKIDKENRYEVELPYIENHPPLSGNKQMAVRRLELTIKKLKAVYLYKEYDSILQEWLRERQYFARMAT